MNHIHTRYKYLLLLSLLMMLFACSLSPVNQTNFDKINPGMLKADVIKILGDPTDTASMNFAGISGTSATWKYKDSKIVIQFINDKVILKNYVKGEFEKEEQPLESS